MSLLAVAVNSACAWNLHHACFMSTNVDIQCNYAIFIFSLFISLQKVGLKKKKKTLKLYTFFWSFLHEL